MKFLKWLFSTKSKSKKYFPEIILLSYLVITTIVIIIVSNVFELPNTIDKILGGIIIIQGVLLFFPSVSRVFSIMDYKSDKKITEGKINLKFSPILYPIKDIICWLRHAKSPDTIYLKRKDNIGNLIVEVSYEVERRNGPFINKKIFIDSQEIQDLTNIENILTNECLVKENAFYVVAITEMNDPKLFEKIIPKI